MKLSQSTTLMFAVMAVAGSAILTGGLLATASGPDAALRSSYVTALDDTETSWTTPPENVWLSSLTGPVSAPKGLAPGDVITVASKDNAGERIVVTELELIDGERLGLPGVRFQLVTGRASDDESGRTVRFLFANEAAPATGAAALHPRDRSL